MKSSGIKLNRISIFNLELATAVFLAYTNIIAGLNWITNDGLTGPIGMIRYLCITYFFSMLGYELLKRAGKIPTDILIVFIFFLLAYLISMLNGRSYEIITGQKILINTFLECLPVYISLRLIHDYKKLWNKLLFVSWFVFVLYSISFFVYNVGDTNNYRTFSSGLIFVSGIFLINWLYSNEKKYIFPSVLSIVFIATCGRRSSLVSLVILVAIVLILKKDYKKLFLSMLIAISIALFWESLLLFFYNVCVGFGVRPRILVRILSGTINDDSHRFEQWSYVFNLLGQSAKNAILGLGIAGERSYMLSHFAHMKIYGYPHCILVELIGHFGFIFGPLLEIYLLVVGPIRTIKNHIYSTEYIKIFLFGITIASALLFQDSYLQSKFFFFYLAFIIDNTKERKNVEALA